MARFYGWGWEDVKRMDYQELHLADLGIRILDAQERLADLKTASYPTMIKKDRENYHRSLHKMAYPRSADQKAQAIEPEQLLEMLSVGR